MFTASGTAILRKLAVAAAGLTCGVPLLPSASRYAQRELLRSTVRELLRTVYS
ncbi:hypothetical protein ABIB17_002697 [Arthrobacter sp. UYEF6]